MKKRVRQRPTLKATPPIPGTIPAAVPATLAGLRERLRLTRKIRIPVGADDLEFEVRLLSAQEEAIVRVHMAAAIPPIKMQATDKGGASVEEPVMDLGNPLFQERLERLYGEGKALAVFIGCPLFQGEPAAGCYKTDGTLDAAKVSVHVLSHLPSLASLDALYLSVMPETLKESSEHLGFFSSAGSRPG